MSGTEAAPLSSELLARLARVSTGTACNQLVKLGISRCFMDGITPMVPVGANKRIVGRAVTARFLPVREDVSQAWRTHEAFRQRIDALQPQDVLVIDAMGGRGAIVGDIFCARIKHQGVAGVVVDGSVRDVTGMREVGMPVFAQRLYAVPAPPYVVNMDVDLPIQCGATLVVPGDAILADDDGVVVVPKSLAEKVAEAGAENEEVEAFMRKKVEEGFRICDIYPPTPAVQKELTEFRARLRRG